MTNRFAVSHVALLALPVAGCAGKTTAEAADEADLKGKRCDAGCVVSLFKELAKVPRPSMGEAQARAWVKGKVEASRPLVEDVRDGVAVLHARDYETTLGADAGQGVAQTVRALG